MAFGLNKKLPVLWFFLKHRCVLCVLGFLLILSMAFYELNERFSIVREGLVASNNVMASAIDMKIDSLLDYVEGIASDDSNDFMHHYSHKGFLGTYHFDGDDVVSLNEESYVNKNILQKIASETDSYYENNNERENVSLFQQDDENYIIISAYSPVKGVYFSVIDERFFNEDMESYIISSNVCPALVAGKYPDYKIAVGTYGDLYNNKDFFEDVLKKGESNNIYLPSRSVIIVKSKLSYGELSLWIVKDWRLYDFYTILPLYGYFAIIMVFILNIYFFRIYAKSEAKEKVKAKDLFNNAMEVTDHGILFYGKDGKIVKANTIVKSLFPDEKIYLLMDDFLSYMFDNAAILEHSILANLNDFKGDNGRSYDFREIIITDEDVVCLVQAKQIGGGEVIIVITDITAFSKLEENILNLNKKNYELFSAIEATDTGIAIVDVRQDSGSIIFANEAYSRISGIEKNEIVGHDFAEVLKFQCGEDECKKIFDELDDNKGSLIEYSSNVNGVSEWHSLTISHVYDENGYLELYILFLSDVTDVKLKEIQYIQSQKLESMGQISAGVAHDFNNILSIVDGYARMVRNKSDNEEIKDYASKINKAVDKGASLTRQLLTFSKHKVVTETVLDVSNAIKENEILWKPLIKGSINLTVDIRADNLFIECASDTFSQIIMNLVVNARDAINGTGNISVGVDKVNIADIACNRPEWVNDGEYVCIIVSDDGSGMDEDIKKKIFDPFFSTKEQGKGTGLGLSMVYGMVKNLKGFIDVTTEIGAGTNMNVYIPLSNKKPTKEIVKDKDGKISLNGYTVLVAEDEKDLLCIVTGMLEEMGMNVLSASDGNEALMVQDEYEGDIDFLLTDVVMPELNGIKLAELFKSVRPETKIIFMSGYPSKGGVSNIELPEHAVFMAKPVKFDTLEMVLHEKASGAESSDGSGSVYWQVGNS